MNEERFDRMMKAYCHPETEAFTYHDKNHRGLKAASVIAAALVLVVFGTLIIPSLTKSKHSFVLTVNAAERATSDEQIGTAYTRVNLYDKDHAYVGEYSVMDAEILMDGEDIRDISFRSLNGCGEFFMWHNPVKEEWYDDRGMWYDANGNEDAFFNGAPEEFYIDLGEDYYAPADIEHTNDWTSEYRYSLSYTAIDDDGCFLQPEDASEDRNDIVEITVTFTDGESQTHRLSVTYHDGVMTVDEISG